METKLNKILLASVSHEFRTPLNAINANSMLMATNPQQIQINKRPLQIISASVELMLSLVEDILDLAKLGSGNFKLVMTEFSLKELL